MSELSLEDEMPALGGDETTATTQEDRVTAQLQPATISLPSRYPLGVVPMQLQQGAASGTATPADPPATTSLTGVMAGYALRITPVMTGRVKVQFSGVISTNTANDGVSVALRYGTGAPPVAAGAPAGTALGTALYQSGGPVGGMAIPFTLDGLLTGMTLNQTYWFDVMFRAVTGGTASIVNSQNSAVEL